jgi:hypothetical protein
MNPLEMGPGGLDGLRPFAQTGHPPTMGHVPHVADEVSGPGAADATNDAHAMDWHLPWIDLGGEG